MEQTLLQLLQPLTFAVLAIGFVGIFIHAHNLKAAAFWAASFMCGAVSFFIEVVQGDQIAHVNFWMTSLLSFFAAALFIVGHFVRRDVSPPYAILITLGLGCAASIVVFRHASNDLTTCIIMLNLIYGAVFATGVPLLIRRGNRVGKPPLVDAMAGTLLALYVVTFPLRMAMLGLGIIDVGLTDATYFNSWTAITLRFSTTVAAITSAVCLYVMLGMDLVDDVQRSSQLDPMTRLFNKATFTQKAADVMETCTKKGETACLMMCDLDHFKAVNDSCGHAAGDVVITFFGRMLGNTVRTGDIGGRVGGEEFAVLLPGCPEPNAHALAEAVREVVADNELHAAGHDLHITASFGVAEMQPGETFAELYARTDALLYEAKRAGRNRVRAAQSCASTRPVREIAPPGSRITAQPLAGDASHRGPDRRLNSVSDAVEPEADTQTTPVFAPAGPALAAA